MLICISSNGQVTIPKPIRDSLQLKNGDQIQARVQDGKIVLERVADEFEIIFDEAHKQAKQAGLKKADISKAVTKARGGK